MSAESLFVPRLAPMSHRQNDDFLFVVAIENDIRPAAELDHPFAELGGQLLDGTAHLRKLAQQLYALPDRLDGALGRVAALGSQKVVQSRHIPQAVRRPAAQRPPRAVFLSPYAEVSP